MASDANVYISIKGRDDRRLIVDGSMGMVIDILRELGREALAERAAQESSAVQKPSTDSGVSSEKPPQSAMP